MRSVGSIRVFHLAWLALALAAAGLRFADLESKPLDNHEARLALNAASAGPHASPFREADESPATEPGYSAPTSLVFQLFGATASGARALPAVAGTLLALLPLVLRRQLGEARALASAGLLAFSPIAVAASRTGGAATIAGLGLAILFAALMRGMTRGTLSGTGWSVAPWTGLGLVLAAGRPGYVGLMGFGLGVVLFSLASRRQPQSVPDPGAFSMGHLWVTPLVALVVVSGAGFAPLFVSGLFGGLGEWIAGWSAFGGMAAGPALAAAILYEPMAVLLGIAAAWNGIRRSDRLAAAAGSWVVGASIAIFIYPARRPEDLIWIVVPLCLLGGDALVRLIERKRPSEQGAGLGSLAGVLIVLLAFAAVQFSAFGHLQGPAFTGFAPAASLWLGVGAVGIAAVITVLFGAGWSYAAAAEAGAVAGLAAAAAITLASLWRLNFDARAFGAGELYRPQASGPSLDLLVQTTEAFSLASTGRADAIPLDVRGDPPPALAWALRRFPRRQPSFLSTAEQPPVVLVAEDEPPTLGADYLGQTFLIGERWAWGGILPADPVTWMVRREGRTVPERWLLLLRADLVSLGEARLAEGAGAP
ncbi:MAG: hypothetical protein ACRDHY_04850 [Anaerolineales bacterium]